jgi:hypothetical protein
MPLVLSVIGLSATIHLSIYEDFGLLIAGALDKKLKKSETV